MAESVGLQKFKALMRKLLPRGKAWNKEDGSAISLLTDSMAVEFCRVEDRYIQLLVEADPNRTLELISDWERYLGLPDACVDDPESQTLDQRRDQIKQKLANNNRQSRQFFEDLLEGFGFDEAEFEIIECRVSRCGEARCGDARSTGLECMFVIEINLPVQPDDLYMLCKIQELKPAHTFVVFNFGG
ncbi:MAG: hypothetical protein COX62_01405 [Deltaproteobacteria bacterium CG_4_10_14_0_2_um_filter_43_8]|nr:MAG: hypothetical protein COV43_04435 [Deltaproteobacteria bacterium CG11_big_fil_rev_8_21_14_0_20_42_23]PJA21809.1 MAG: hypothetical protein COX62_01405 [Deltaproteobacteria bacterium CG_4_10_14_0_2_um_filter_43_8]PJC65022.1 MAG: hypothetical protein CO021_00825 [Deltaproteobacteria bacterium CG_4_9_14_0_2_um_filter_42_21]